MDGPHPRPSAPHPRMNKNFPSTDGDQIAPADAFEYYTKDLKLSSSGVLAVSMAECGALELPVTPDTGLFPEHALIDFSAYGKSAIEKKAKLLKAKALPGGHRTTNSKGHELLLIKILVVADNENKVKMINDHGREYFRIDSTYPRTLILDDLLTNNNKTDLELFKSAFLDK